MKISKHQRKEPQNMAAKAKVPAEFYTIDEFAELTKVSPNTIRNMVKAGKIDYYRIGRQVRIPPESIEALKNRKPTGWQKLHPEKAKAANEKAERSRQARRKEKAEAKAAAAAAAAQEAQQAPPVKEDTPQ